MCVCVCRFLAVQTIGTTIDGRPINCITIASTKNNSIARSPSECYSVPLLTDTAIPFVTGKVGFVYNGGQHAQEWVSPMTNAFIAYQLVSLYGKVREKELANSLVNSLHLVQDAEVTHMVDNIEWTIIPVLNCDGYVYSWTNNWMWRKNRLALFLSLLSLWLKKLT